MTHTTRNPKIPTLRFIVFFAVALLCASVFAEMKPKTYKVIDTQCDIAEQEIATGGQFVCHYICRDEGKSKAAVVYSNSGVGKCRTPIPRKIKVPVEAVKKVEPPKGH